jgi:hypothetical protein
MSLPGGSHMGIMGINGARKLDGGMKGERGEGSTVILEDKKSYMYMFTKRWLRDVRLSSGDFALCSFSLFEVLFSFLICLWGGTL